MIKKFENIQDYLLKGMTQIAQQPKDRYEIENIARVIVNGNFVEIYTLCDKVYIFHSETMSLKRMKFENSYLVEDLDSV